MLIKIFCATLFSFISFTAIADEPATAVKSFYNRFISPSKADYGKPSFEYVEDLVTADLLVMLKAQNEYENHCVQITPVGDKPHMLDQNPFFSAADQASVFRGTKTTISNKIATVVVELSYGGSSWYDKVILHKENGQWLISDIYWGDGGKLSNRLSEFVKVNCITE